MPLVPLRQQRWSSPARREHLRQRFLERSDGPDNGNRLGEAPRPNPEGPHRPHEAGPADSADDVPVGWLLEYLGTCGYPLMLRVRGEASCSSCGPAGSPAERRVRAPYVRRADTRPDPKARPADRTAPRAPARDRSRPCGPGRIPADRPRRCAGQPRHCPAAGRRASRAGGTRSAGDHPPLRLWDEALALVVRVAADDLESRSETAQKPDYRTNTPAWLARSRKYCGATPSTSVTATPTAIVVIVSGDGTATVGPSAFGSLKNIRTITRM